MKKVGFVAFFNFSRFPRNCPCFGAEWVKQGRVNFVDKSVFLSYIVLKQCNSFILAKKSKKKIFFIFLINRLSTSTAVSGRGTPLPLIRTYQQKFQRFLTYFCVKWRRIKFSSVNQVNFSPIQYQNPFKFTAKVGKRKKSQLTEIPVVEVG